jgi:hypothetical protein
MQAYLNDPELKIKLIGELEKHKAADAIVKGVYGSRVNNPVGFRGCAVGCTLHSLGYTGGYDNHSAYEPLLGIPQSLARIQDGIFEGLPNADALEWPMQFAQAIRPGADLLPVVDRFMLALMVDEKFGVCSTPKPRKQRQ